jgi:hypothetical protein
VAGLTLAPASELRRREFWRRALVHQAPMIVAMALMTTVLRSTLGLLVIIAGLWLVALVRARAARTSISAREFLVDMLAMGVVLIVPLIHAGSSSMSMPGMAATSLGGRATAVILILAWAGARYALLRMPAGRPERTGSVVSASCCALGLVAMLVI